MYIWRVLHLVRFAYGVCVCVSEQHNYVSCNVCGVCTVVGLYEVCTYGVCFIWFVLHMVCVVCMCLICTCICV